MADQSPHSVDLVGSFTEKIKHASDVGNAAAGDTAIALAIMELARQKRIENLVDYLTLVRGSGSTIYTGRAIVDTVIALTVEVEAELGVSAPDKLPATLADGKTAIETQYRTGQATTLLAITG